MAWRATLFTTGKTADTCALSLLGRVSHQRLLWVQQSAHSLATAGTCAQHAFSCHRADQAKWPKPRAKSHQARRFSSLLGMLFDLFSVAQVQSDILLLPFTPPQFIPIRECRSTQVTVDSGDIAFQQKFAVSKTSLFSSHTTPTPGSPTKAWQGQIFPYISEFEKDPPKKCM